MAGTRLVRTLMVVSGVAVPSTALAVPVSVDVGNSEVAHRVTGSPLATYSYVSRSGDFAPGSYSLQVGESLFPFQVLASGALVATPNAMVDVVGSTLVLRPSHLIEFEPNGNTMLYRLPNTPVYNVAGYQDLLVPPGTYLNLCVASTCRFITVASDGTVSTPASQSTFTIVGSSVVFNPPVEVAVDPQGADMAFRFPSTPTYNVTGPQTALLFRDIDTTMCIADSCWPFHVGSSGTLSGAANESVAFGFESVVFSPPRSVTYDPGDARVGYRVLQTSVYNVTGVRSGALVPDVWTQLCIGTSCFPIRARPAGSLEGTPNPALSFSGSTARFAAVSVHVVPGSAADQYRFNQQILPVGASWLTGTTDSMLVPGTTMDFCTPTACTPVSISSPCDRSVTLGGKSFHITCAAPVADSDGDGVPDDADLCPGANDTHDFDADGTPDGCDACPADYYNDSDGDGACDSDDSCMLDADDDADGDGLCADVDPCPADPDDDADGDAICGDLDACPLDAQNDADGDGICGNADTCADGDDGLDADGDAVADACDVCPFDASNDADGDATCADEDPCPFDALDDADGDGTCADEDPCPLDALDDADGDGLCADADPCPVDVTNDADGDGLCESDDNCATLANENQSDVDADGIGDACEPDKDGDGLIDDLDNCPLDANVSQADGDGDGLGDVCDADDDNDGVLDAIDTCLGTPPGNPVLANGCAVAEQCRCDSPWKNHGAYVKCVSQSSGALLTAGTITSAQRDAMVSVAGQASCGKR